MDPTLSVPSQPETAPTHGPGCETCLSPEDEFPTDLGRLPLVELQVLHSRIECQLEREYLEDPSGPHPVTQDRHDELVAELEARGRTDG